MKIKTINTIELSSICDNACEYCPAKDQSQYRPTGLMQEEVYKKAVNQVLKLCRAGTQLELNLFGVGESTLHPQLIEWVEYARKHLPFNQTLHLNTNGNRMTHEMANGLQKAGISSIDITGHNHKSTAKTIKIFRDIGIAGNLSYDFVTAPNNWAGQVDWFEPDNRLPHYRNNPCPWLARGQIMVMSNGNITTCCIDAFGKNVFGNIFDDLDKLEIKESELCQTCHHKIPEAHYPQESEAKISENLVL